MITQLPSEAQASAQDCTVATFGTLHRRAWHTVGSILAIHETDPLQNDATAYDPTVMTVRYNGMPSLNTLVYFYVFRNGQARELGFRFQSW
jgi:hypothetical protein